MRVQSTADLVHPGRARRAVVARGTHLDQLVGQERSLDFGDHGIREALVADDHHGLELVREAAQFAAARGGQCGFHAPIIGEARTLESGEAMKKSHSSKQWLRRHVEDPYVKRSKREGYRSRAAYKLLEIDERDRLLKPGMVAVDLGSAPGGWSQVLGKKAGTQGVVVAIDLLPMEPVANVAFIRGDFARSDAFSAVEAALEGRKADLVISDISPNLTGIASIDQARSMEMSEIARDFALRHLKREGAFLVKVFQGEGYADFHRSLKEAFEKVAVRKPDASRGESAELYLLARVLRSAP